MISAYTQSELWQKWQCRWLESHTDKNTFLKIWFFIRSLVQFVILLPSYKLVHIHLSEPASAIRKLNFFLIASFFRKKTIAHFHSFSTDTTIDGKSQNLYYRIFRLSDRIIVLSKSWKDRILAKWPEFSTKIVVLYNPCPVVHSVDYMINAKTILYAGALIERKGYSDLIRGFGRIAGRFKDWKVVLAGNGEIEKAAQLARELEIEDQVELKGWVAGKEKDMLFRGASIFCLPSYAEGFPMAVIDAWAYGLPVITTLVGGLPDIIIEGKNALVIKPGDIEGISDILAYLISDDTKRTQLSEESLNLSRNIFSLDEIARQLDSVYKVLTRN